MRISARNTYALEPFYNVESYDACPVAPVETDVRIEPHPTVFPSKEIIGLLDAKERFQLDSQDGQGQRDTARKCEATEGGVRVWNWQLL